MGIDGRLYFAMPQENPRARDPLNGSGSEGRVQRRDRRRAGPARCSGARGSGDGGVDRHGAAGADEGAQLPPEMAQACDLEVHGTKYARMQLLTVEQILAGKRLLTPSVVGRDGAAGDAGASGTGLMRMLTEIEARAASKAINQTLGMFEDTFHLRAKGRDPSARRESVIQELKRRFDELRQRAQRPVRRGPLVSDLVSRIEKAAALQQGLRLDQEMVQRLAKVIPQGALGQACSSRHSSRRP